MAAHLAGPSAGAAHAASHSGHHRGVMVTSPASTSQPLGSSAGRPAQSRWRTTPAPTVLWQQRQQARGAVSCRTMAPDKSQLVNNLNHLLRLTDSESGPRSPSPFPSQQPAPISSRPLYSTSHPAPAPTTAAAVSPAPTARLPPLPGPSADDDYHPSDGWRPRAHHLQQQALWERIREEAALDAVLEPALATHLHSVILSHRTMDSAMAFLLANKLADGMMLGAVQLMSLIREVYASDPSILAAAVADMNAVLDRDPACAKYSQCMLQFKGWQAVQVHRITHSLWQQGRQALALALQSRVCELFSVDIHPAAQLGRGVMLDHATGIVIGETAVVGDNVSMLHHVSLGGSGTGRGVRHPHIGHGVLLGAGVAVLGPVTVGAGSKVGAGSVVVSDLPAHCVAVGVPARIVKRDIRAEPVQEMDQCADFILDYVI